MQKNSPDFKTWKLMKLSLNEALACCIIHKEPRRLQMLKVKITAGQHKRIACPVIVPLDIDYKGPVKLKGKNVEFNGEAKTAGGKSALIFMIDTLAAGSEEIFDVEKTAENREKITFKEIGSEKLEIYKGKHLLTNYWCDNKFSKPFIHPIPFFGLSSVTRNFPMVNVPGESTDHKHHRSIWTAWGDVNGIDCWSEEEGHGFIIQKYFTLFSEGYTSANFRMLNHWTDRNRKKLLEENRSVTIYNAGEDFCLIDFESKYFASESDVVFGDTKEGGLLCVRMATPLEGDKGGRIANAYGALGEEECWGKKAPWCDYSGTMENKKVGITLFDSPNNPGYPVHWHARNYGLFAANPFGVSGFTGNRQLNGSYTLKKGNEMIFEHRMLIHKGWLEESVPEIHFNNYINPPKVTILL